MALLDPAPTDTEKVGQAHAGWEMWVADPSLINQLARPPLPRPPPSMTNSPSSSLSPRPAQPIPLLSSLPIPPLPSPPRASPPYAAAYELSLQPPSRSSPGPPRRFQPSQPQQVCLECMMRDRDLADVDVLGHGVWDRASDADFHAALAADLAPPSSASSASSSPLPPSLLGSASAQLHPPPRKHVRPGEPLTAPALKTWTQMNPPPSSHRWKTLQAYLKEQRHYLDLERRARASAQLENDRAEQLIRSSADPHTPRSLGRSDHNLFSASTHTPHTRRSSSTPTLLPNGLRLETVDVSKDEKGPSHWCLRPPTRRLSRVTCSLPRPQLPLLFNSPSTPAHYAQSAAFPSSPALRSSQFNHNTSSAASPRLPSPSRLSLASRRSAFTESKRPFSGWSMGRKSVSHSMLSLAPSGSMMDMHLGLSTDRHQHLLQAQDTLSPSFTSSPLPHTTSHGSARSSPSASVASPVVLTDSVQLHPKQRRLFRTFRGLLSKLKLGSSARRDSAISPQDLGANVLRRGQPISQAGLGGATFDEEPLVPPPSLSILAREQQCHRRNQSALSLPLSTASGMGPGASGFRPQSLSNGTVGGPIDTAISSPVSHLGPPSPVFTPGSSSPYMDSHQILDSLAEELDMAAASVPQESGRRGVRSMSSSSTATGTANLTPNRVSHWHHSGQSPYNGVCESVAEGDRDKPCSVAASPLTRKTSALDRGRRKSFLTVTSHKSSRLKERNSSPHHITTSTSTVSSSGAFPSAPHHNSHSTDQGSLRSIEAMSKGAPIAAGKNYMPLEKTRRGVSRSSDFLALRYISLSPRS